MADGWFLVLVVVVTLFLFVVGSFLFLADRKELRIGKSTFGVQHS